MGVLGGLGQGDLVLDGANLVWAPGNTQDITDRNITFGDNPITFTMQDPVTLANDFGFDGIADLTKAGAGTLTLTTDVYMNGNIIVQGGALSLGNGGAAGTVFGSINLADPATKLIINRSDDGFFSNVISGPGSLEHAGSGNTLRSGVNTFTGQTTIAAGGSLGGYGGGLPAKRFLLDLEARSGAVAAVSV